MLKNLLFICLLWSMAQENLLAQNKEEPQPLYSRVRVELKGQDWQRVRDLGLECDHGSLQQGEYWISDLSEADLELLRAQQIDYTVLIRDVREHYVRQNDGFDLTGSIRNPYDDCTGRIGHYSTPQNFRLGSMGGYLTYAQMLEELDSMCSKYPDLISCRKVIDSSTTTHGGHYIYWVKISDNPNSDENEPEALYTSLHHSREPLSLMQNIYYMWFLLENYATDEEVRYLVDNSELYFIPCVNPDGYVYNNTQSPNGGGMWRKNRRNNGNGTFGVDLNRNYGYAFAFNNTGSSGTASSDTYRGPSAFSEPETRNVKTFCEAHNFQLSLNYHSYGNMVVYPWAYNSAATPDSSFFRAYARFMVYENSYITGSNMETVGYNTNGDADDWLYGEQTTKNKILAMTPEAGGQQGGFYPAAANIEELCRGLIWQNLALPRTMLNYGVLELKPDNYIATRLNSFMSYDLTRYGFSNQGFTVSLTPLTTNIDAVGAPKQHTPAQFATLSDSISFTLKSSVNVGDQISLVVTLNNGTVNWHDTVHYTLGSALIAFADTSSSLQNWANLSPVMWTTTTSTFYTAPNCITESPAGDYNNNTTTELLLTQTLDLRGKREAYLRFWAKWEIEEDYDYVQVLAAANGGTFIPLCGLYTNPGTADQIENEPLFDGTQSFWVQEQMSLAAFLGAANVTLKLRFVSDGAVRADGFYFDDFTVYTIDTPTVTPPIGTNVLQAGEPLFLPPSQPNPARYSVFLPLPQFDGSLLRSERLELVVFNALGQNMHRQQINTTAGSTGIMLNLDAWAAGVYYYQLRAQSGSWQSNTQKLVVE